MIVLDWKGIEVDTCVSCGGVWLDAGEVELMAEKAGADPAGLSERLRRGRRGEQSDRSCPRCGKKMRGLTVCEGNPVELDRCPRGHGIWFDRGELERFIGQCEGGGEKAVAAFFADLFRDRLSTDVKGE